MSDWNSEYVTFADGAEKRKVHRKDFFPHKGFTIKSHSTSSQTKVMTPKQAWEKDQRYRKSSEAMTEKYQIKTEKAEPEVVEPPKPIKKVKPKKQWDRRLV